MVAHPLSAVHPASASGASITPALPYYTLTMQYLPYCRLPRVLLLSRIPGFVAGLERCRMRWGFTQMSSFGPTLFMITLHFFLLNHYIACAWMLLHRHSGTRPPAPTPVSLATTIHII